MFQAALENRDALRDQGIQGDRGMHSVSITLRYRFFDGEVRFVVDVLFLADRGVFQETLPPEDLHKIKTFCGNNGASNF